MSARNCGYRVVWRCPLCLTVYLPLADLHEHLADLHNVTMDGEPVDDRGILNDRRTTMNAEMARRVAPLVKRLNAAIPGKVSVPRWGACSAYAEYRWPASLNGEVL